MTWVTEEADPEGYHILHKQEGDFMQDVPWTQLIIGVLIAAVYLMVKITSGKKKKRIKTAIDGGALVLDVRSPAEYAGGHYQGALNIPVDKLRAKTKSLGSKDRSVVVYCASGGRSSMAHSLLREEGFTNVLDTGGLGSMPS